MLTLTLAPAYLAWKVINDERILDRLLSDYREIAIHGSNCVLREVKIRGGPDNFGLSLSFAAQGTDRWLISVVLPREPDADEIESHCATLNLLVDFMRDPASRSPNFPGTDEPIVETYPDMEPRK